MISIDAWDRKCQALNEALSKVAKLKKRIEELEEREQKLDALEVAGVDNWEGYDIAMDILSEEKEV